MAKITVVIDLVTPGASYQVQTVLKDVHGTILVDSGELPVAVPALPPVTPVVDPPTVS